MGEIWKAIDRFDGYQVSNKGRVRSYWKKKRKEKGYGTYRLRTDDPYIMPTSDDGNGYQKLSMRSDRDNKDYCRKVHKLVADAFLPHGPEDGDTVDHIKSGPEGKLDNSVENLRWMPRGDNVRKAYEDGMHDRRIRNSQKDIFAIDLWTGDEIYFSSIKEASEELHIDRSSISHVLRGDFERTSHYRFEYAGNEGRMLYGSNENKLLTWLRHGLR